MSAKTDTSATRHDGERGDEPTEFQVIDKRHFLDLESLDKTPAAEEKPRYPSFVEELLGRMAETERRFQERKAQFEAEIARTKSRLEADFERRVGQEKQKMLLPMLDVLDNLERALASAAREKGEASLREGVELTANLFRAKLRALGIEAIEVLAKPFDPTTSLAVGVLPVSDPAEDRLVKQEVLPGYRIGEQVLRPASVLVGRHLQNQ